MHIDAGQVYNVWLTQHGVIMIFFFIMPYLIGAVGNKEVPENLGVCDFVLCRLNNLSF